MLDGGKGSLGLEELYAVMGLMAKCLAQGARMIGAQCCIALLSSFLHGYGGGFAPSWWGWKQYNYC